MSKKKKIEPQQSQAQEHSPSDSPEPRLAESDTVAEAAEKTAADDIETLRQQLQEESDKAAEHYDQWLRSVAELRNYKKRVQQERQQQTRGANAQLISHLLPVLDDFERALISLPDEQLRQFTWIEGIQIIYHRLQSILQQHGLQAIEAIGQPFNPYFHEGILFDEVPPEQDQLVLEDLQRGYKLYDQVLRPTLVKVGRGAIEPTETAPPPETEQEPSPPD